MELSMLNNHHAVVRDWLATQCEQMLIGFRYRASPRIQYLSSTPHLHFLPIPIITSDRLRKHQIRRLPKNPFLLRCVYQDLEVLRFRVLVCTVSACIP